MSAGGRLHEIDLSLRAGEMLGVIGVSGNGQAALGELLSGLLRTSAGTLTLDGAPYPQGDVRSVIEAGVGRIPEDRGAEGTIAEMTVWENAVLERAFAPPFSRRGLIDAKAGRAFADHLVAEFDVRGGAPDRRIGLLSGGNIQKLVLGRSLAQAPRLLVAAQPTRGLDEGAIAAVHTALLEARGRGAAVLLISEDLDEVVSLADRIQAIVKGRLSPPVDAKSVDARRLGLMMAGDWTGLDAARSEADHAA